ncbi:hypothetical protein [Fibrisoma montanum]|uniref:hypothetical protein n=1 Tax=Fibrisoma montanum TaxID=2305895 RepID=UPI0013148195|nr:hypothetical protein [Fibrisoma montanum]
MNHTRKQLGIGPGGINCPCCVDYPAKRRKRAYRKLERTIQKRMMKQEERTEP